MKYDSLVMMEQIKVIDEKRIIKYIGKLSPKFMRILDKRLKISLGLVPIRKGEIRVMIKQDIIQFSGNNVPISEVAKIMKKDKQFVRIGIQEKWLPIGVAYKKEGSSEYSYYVSPKKLYEYTGYIYRE